MGHQYAKVHEDVESEGPYATVTINDPPIEGPYAEMLGENPYAEPRELFAIQSGKQRFQAPELPPRGSPSASDDDTSRHNYVNQNTGKYVVIYT